MRTFKLKPSTVRHAAVWLLFWFAIFTYFETLLHFVVYERLAAHFLYVIGFSFSISAVFAAILSLMPKKAAYWITFSLTVLLLVFYGSQIVYYYVFGGLYSPAQTKLGGGAITSFWRELLITIRDHIPSLLLLFAPSAAMLIFKRKARKWLIPADWISGIGMVVLAFAAFLCTVLCLRIGGTGYYTTYYFFNSNTTTIEQAVDRFGLLTAFGRDIFADDTEDSVSYYVPTEETNAPTEAANAPEDTVTNETNSDESADSTEVTEVTQPPEPEVTYNVLDIDFDKLNKLTEDEKILALNQYCASLTGTNKNEYTGMLSDYNLILICAESFSPATIDPVLTPTLYRLSTQGIVFNNFYNTYPNTTIDGEYTLCTGLYPDGARNKWSSTFNASADKYLPYALGNAFGEQRGIQTYGYHNYLGTYFDRVTSHPNLGYSMKFMEDGMTFSSSWPSSDLEMMEQSVGDYIGSEPFHAYYMTFSGHYTYNREANYMAALNWKKVKDLEYSETSRAYLSCNLELEKAMSYLMDQLLANGVADKTAIVICPDHFPYGLTDEQYSELIGYEIDDFSKFKSTLIFWVGGLHENIVVDEYCCNADILPTILNLWGFEFDSRMLAGTDVFSDGNHMAILRDYSFYTDKLWFNASTGELRYLVPESEIPANYLDNMIRLVNTKYSVSVDILHSDYYSFVYSNTFPQRTQE